MKTYQITEQDIVNEDIKKMIDIMGNATLSNLCHIECDIDTNFDNECSLCRQATALYKAGYRKRSETVKEFAEKIKFGMAQFGYYYCGSNGVEYFGDIQVNDFNKMIKKLAE